MCCMKEEVAFAGCHFQPTSGCQYNFHQVSKMTAIGSAANDDLQEEYGLRKWLIIKDRGSASSEL